MARRAALVLAIGASFPSQAQQVSPRDFCRANALAEKTSDRGAYARRLGGYCDGVIFRPEAGSSELPVIGVMGAPVTGNPAATTVQVNAMVPPELAASINWPLRLQGVARSKTINYRLDAGLEKDGFLALTGDSGLAQRKPPLTAGDVAWAAWTESATHGRTYVPVGVRGTAERAIEIVVRPTIHTAYVTFAIADDSGNTLKEAAIVGSNLSPGEPLSFSIPIGQPAVVIVNVLAVGNGGDKQGAAIRLLRLTSAPK